MPSVLDPDPPATAVPAAAHLPPTVAVATVATATATATSRRHVAAVARHAGLLAQALQDHQDLPDAERAARVLAALQDASSDAGCAGQAFDLVALQALQAHLAPADALLVYGHHGDELLACVVRGSGVQVFRRLARWHEVQAAWRLARFQLDALCQGAGPPRAQWPKLLKRAQARWQALHGLVWAPLADALADARRVLLLPGAGLAGLPFAALQDGLTCLAQRHLLAEVPSLALALRAVLPPVGPGDAAMSGSLDPTPLPSCAGEGGAGGVRGGADLAHRVQALLAGGTPRVLVRRWPVDDAVTAAFMDRFQQERQRGRGPAEALSEAQAGLMVNHPHPAFWAGFALYGGW